MSEDELPRGWAACRLDAVAEVRLGRQRSPDRATGPHMTPYMRAANVSWNGLSLHDVKEMDFSPGERVVYELRKGDVLVGEASGSRDEVGKSALWNEQIPGACFQNTLIRVRPRDGTLEPSFVQLRLKHDALRGALADASRGVGIHHLGREALAGWTVALPPLNEQRRIVAKLEDLLARSRRAKDALEAIPPLLEKLRQSILAAAFRGDLTADWRTKNPDVEPAEELLKRIRVERRKKWEEAELAKLRAKGKAPTDDRWKAKYPEPDEPEFLNPVQDLPQGWTWASLGVLAECLDAQRVPVSRDERKEGPFPYFGANGQVGTIDRYIFDEPLVLVTEDETFYGRTKPIAYEIDGKCWVNNHAHVLRPVHPVSVQFLRLSLMHYPVEPWLSGSTGRAKLTQGALMRLPMALPPAGELLEVVRLLNQGFVRIERVSPIIASTCASLALADSTLLAKAFRGELVEQDPSDEPASVMLARLAAERAGDSNALNTGAAKNAAPGKRKRRAG